MILPRHLFLGITLALAQVGSKAQDIEKTVVRIRSVKPTIQIRAPRPDVGVGLGFGTGFCLDPACKFIATNYHVAATVKPYKVEGETIVRQFLGTGPEDRYATPHEDGTKMLAYAARHDLAIFELQYPLRHHHGIEYSLEDDDLEAGREVDIYAFPVESIIPTRKLLKFSGTFRGITTNDLLEVAYAPVNGNLIRGGASGGVVVDRKTQKIVGILSEVGIENPTLAFAVRVRSLAELVKSIDPFLAQQLFPDLPAIPPITADLNPKFVPEHQEGLQHRSEEPTDVKLLRRRAQDLADGMKDLIAVERFAWGRDQSPPLYEASYQLRVVDGDLKFRRFPDGKKERSEQPRPSFFSGLDAWANAGDDWSVLPTRVARDGGLIVRQAPDAVVNGQKIKVFQYYGTLEDQTCGFEPSEYFLWFKVLTYLSDVFCSGEVWTDDQMNLLRISETLDLPANKKETMGWQHYRDVLTYKWLQQEDGSTRLVPDTVFTEGQLKRHIYWCRGQFTDYQKFQVRSRLVASQKEP